jgi:hypothetical protein
MADKLEPKDPGATGEISAADLGRILEDIKRQKSLASEYAGNAAAATKNACERYGLEKTALTFCRRLDEMDATKRSAVLRNLILYSNLRGHFAQIDAFDDLVGILEDIVEEAKERSSSPKSRGGTEMDALLN